MKIKRSKNIKRFSAEVVETLPLMFREFSKREDNALTRGKISFPQMVALHFASQKKYARSNLLNLFFWQFSVL